jgi:hypothetical protein
MNYEFLLPPKADLLEYLKICARREEFLPRQMGVFDEIIERIATGCGGEKMSFLAVKEQIKAALSEQFSVKKLKIGDTPLEVVAYKISASIVTHFTPRPKL